MGETAVLAVPNVEETSAVSRDGRDEPLFIETLAELSRRRNAEYSTNTAACSGQGRCRPPFVQPPLYAPCFCRHSSL
jgi:hypothetical protein